MNAQENPYDWWQRALAGEKVGGPTLADLEEPQCGFYRYRERINYRERGPWVPVAIFWHAPTDETGEASEDQKLVASVGFATDARIVDPAEALGSDRPVQHLANLPSNLFAPTFWSLVLQNPVTEAAYRAAFDTGRWPDDAPAPASAPAPTVEAPAPIGHNAPPQGNDLDSIKVELAGETETVNEFLKKPVETQEVADQIGPWAKRLTDLVWRADKLREDEKRPHLDASRAVDDKWRQPIASAKELCRKIKAHLEPYLLKKKAEEDARVRAAAEEAERLRKEAEAAAAAAAKAGADVGEQNARMVELNKQAAAAAAAAKPKPVSVGRTGAKVSIRVEKRAEITDYVALLAALSNKTEVRELVETLANRAARADIELPGMKIIEVSKAA